MEHLKRRFTQGIIDIQKLRQRHGSADNQVLESEFRNETDLYKKDVLEAYIMLRRPTASMEERIGYLRKIGAASWTGGSATAKFTCKYISEFLWILREPDEPPRLKIALIKTVIEITWLNDDVKEQFLHMNILDILYDIIDTEAASDTEVQRWAVYALLCLATGNYGLQIRMLQFPTLPRQLRRLSKEIWVNWSNNEALKLCELLDLPEETGDESSDESAADLW